MSLKKAATIVVDNDAEEGKDVIYDEHGKVRALAIVKREIEKIPSMPLAGSDESYKVKELEGLTPEELESEGLRDNEIEFLRGEVFVPEISNASNVKLGHVEEDQNIGIYADRINHIAFEKKYLRPGEKSASPLDSVVKITITGIPPDYSGVNILDIVDEALENKTYQEKKPTSKKE